MASILKEKARLGKFHIEVEEVDISRRDDDDLSQEAKQEEILRRIGAGEFDAVICTPPCSTWSRVRAANMRGPPPIRDRNYPWGYPWVKKKFEQELQLGNILVRFTIRVVETALGVYKVFVLVEHPEDLGTVAREEDKAVLKPASIWQLPDLRKLVGERLATVAINQCCWGAGWRKPTRLLTTSGKIKQWGPNEWPSFDDEGFYEGPLTRDCGCQVAISLAKKSNDEGFRTTGSSVYPPGMDEGIADAIMQHCLDRHTSPPEVGEKRACEACGNEDREERKKKKTAVREEKPCCLEVGIPGKAEDQGMREETSEEGGFRRPGRGHPMQCFYKGKHRTIHDGGGLCSPGRWPIEQRTPLKERDGVELAAVVKAQFLRWLLRKGEVEVKDVFWKLASGQHPSSPFEEIIDEAREAVDGCLQRMGKEPSRKKGDRSSEIAFRRLEAMAEACGDEDSAWMSEMAEVGVPLGVDEELPRAPKVFEPKEKWNLDFLEEALRDSVADNYKSAEESAEDIERQVREEVERGSIVVLSEEEVKERYKGRLAVAALGAVPKEMGSSVVRVDSRRKLQRGREPSHQGSGQDEIPDD